MGRPVVGMLRLQQQMEDMQALEHDPEALGPSGLTQALDPYMDNPRAAFQASPIHMLFACAMMHKERYIHCYV